MASNVNSVVLSGNLTRDPELRFTGSGTAVTTMSIAVNRSYKKGDEWQEEVSFIDVVAWQKVAENVAESMGKGDRVVVHGRLQQRSWENQEGEKRSKVEVVADAVAVDLAYATVPTIERNPKAGGGFRDDAPLPDDGDGW